MKLISPAKAADLLGITEKTVYNLVARGNLTAYRLPGLRAVRIDEDEIREKLHADPTVVVKAGVE